MTKKTTRRALIASVISMLLCVTMLVGTTFAWFTDSVKSGKNRIVAGNLDVELEYLKDGEWKTVDENTNVFKDGTLWEPGHTEVVYLKVKNAGTLALKYNLGVNVASEVLSVNVKGELLKLSDHIMVGVVDGRNTAFATRDEARAAFNANDAKAINEGYAKNGELTAAGKGISEEYVALVVYMPETVGNEANYRTGEKIPEILLGIDLFATQLMAESDSFGNDYDLAAPWAGKIPASLNETTLEIVPGGGTQSGTITINSTEDLVYLNKLAKEWVSLYSNGQGTNVGNYYGNAGGKGTDYYYHWEWTVELAADLDMSNIPMNSIDISYWGNFEGNGHTISNVVLKDGQDGLFINGAKAINDLTVKNITVNAPAAQTVGAVSGNGAMTNVHVVNATVIGGKYVGGICGKGSSFVNCSIKNSTVIANDKTVGGLVGYSVGDPGTATVTGNLVENVNVTGAYNVGGLLGQAQNETVENNTVKNVYLTSNASVPASGDVTEKRTGAVAARIHNATVGTNTVINVNEVLPATPETIQAEIDAAAPGTTIYLAPAKFHTTINMKSGITLVGTKGTVVDCVNLNGADNIALKNIEFDAAGAKMAYDGKGKQRFLANIISGGANKNGKGTNGLLIEGCTFAGNFANGGTTISFNDQGRSSGQSGNITIKGCTFQTTGGYVDIYTYYSGKGTFTIENNIFASDVVDRPIYLGKYQSSTPVVVKDNIFENETTLDEAAAIQAHSTAYTVSFDASGNTFNG